MILIVHVRDKEDGPSLSETVEKMTERRVIGYEYDDISSVRP